MVIFFLNCEIGLHNESTFKKNSTSSAQFLPPFMGPDNAYISLSRAADADLIDACHVFWKPQKADAKKCKILLLPLIQPSTSSSSSSLCNFTWFIMQQLWEI